MIKNNPYKLVVVLALFFAYVFIYSSCKKNKDCDAVINVTDDSLGIPVSGATVHMYPPPASANLNIQDQTGVTDASGSVTFTFKLPAILQADVTSNQFGKGGGLVKLEEGRQVSKTIKTY